ncbi:hypothetical protein MMC18_008488 [Xylographa bjoerkii]|nr:hypothetical protein [Xylographa bjoerkii]MCJ1395334.1 hypothetical protein [Xylographa bjoerkii]MCJ1395602.1 hypothetical protein [Xylographa bjoerkii]
MRPSPSLLDVFAVVVSAGRMMNAAKARTTKQIYNSRVQKHFTISRHHLVSDPTSSLRTGDVIRMTTERHSRHIRHVVTEIVAPWGDPIDERPPVLTSAQREERRGAKRARKLARREERRGGSEGGGDVGGGEGVVVEDAGKERDRKIVETVRRTEREREKAVRRMGEAERVQGGLDERGLGVGEVEKRLEGMRI